MQTFATITQGPQEGKKCLVQAYDFSTSSYFVVVPLDQETLEPIGQLERIPPKHLQYFDLTLDLVFRREPQSLEHQRVHTAIQDRKELRHEATGEMPFHAPEGAWEPGKQRMQRNLRDAHVWVMDPATGKIVYDSLLKAIPHLEGPGVCVHRSWIAPVQQEYAKFLQGVRKQVRKVMREMERDGLDAEDEMEQHKMELETGTGHCFRTVAIYLELGGTGQVCFGSVGLAYSWAKRNHVWWMHGNGAEKSAAWSVGEAQRELATETRGVSASNGKFYAYV